MKPDTAIEAGGKKQGEVICSIAAIDNFFSSPAESISQESVSARLVTEGRPAKDQISVPQCAECPCAKQTRLAFKRNGRLQPDWFNLFSTPNTPMNN